jgi:formamidopyrimidine-DNA glycosylase
MPELPEVETIRAILEPIVKEKTIKAIRVFRDKSVLTGAKPFVKSLVGETFLSVSRMGKFLIFHLTHDKVVVSHLRMEGKYFEGVTGEPVDKHDILIYDFADGSDLRFNDVRKFGIIILTDEAHYKKEPPLSELGKEPWDLTKEELYEGLKKKRSEPIKEALLDQTLIAGLGNIYDDEVLFATEINPKANASSITLEQSERILKESRRILKEAIHNGGSTIRSYHPKEGVSGDMQNHLLAYGQGGKPCSRCGFPLRKIAIGGRGTVYCPHCQRIEGEPLIVGVTGPIASGKSTVTDYLVKKGYEKIDADAIVGELYGSDVLNEKLVAAFGSEAISMSKPNRAFLAKAAIDPSKKKLLEAIVHPEVYAEIEKRLLATKKSKVVLDIPLLIGGPLEEKCDLIIAVFADPKTQEKRLSERGKDPKEALLINKGWPRGAARKKAGLALDGNGSVDELTKQLDKASYL